MKKVLKKIKKKIPGMVSENIAENGSFFDHLEELRHRIIYIIIWFSVGSLISYVFNSQILKLVTHPLSIFQERAVFVSPLEPFFSILKLVFFSGLTISFPFFIYQMYLFVKPALRNDQARVLKISCIAGVILFYSGLCSGYIFLVPYGLKVLLGFGTTTILPMITIGNYLSFFIWMSLIAGFIFQLPVIMFFLGYTKIIEVSWFKRMRKIIYVCILFMSAVITPTTDAFSLLIISGILIFLYEISLIFLVFIFKHK